MFPNEMEFYHFLSPRDSFIPPSQWLEWKPGPPTARQSPPRKHSPVVRLPQKTLRLVRGTASNFPLGGNSPSANENESLPPSATVFPSPWDPTGLPSAKPSNRGPLLGTRGTQRKQRAWAALDVRILPFPSAQDPDFAWCGSTYFKLLVMRNKPQAAASPPPHGHSHRS